MKQAQDYLHDAVQLLDERAQAYDKPGGERSAGKIVAAFNAITGHALTEAEGWLFLQLLKQVRLFARPGFHADSAKDNVAYAALLAERKQQDAVEQDKARKELKVPYRWPFEEPTKPGPAQDKDLGMVGTGPRLHEKSLDLLLITINDRLHASDGTRLHLRPHHVLQGWVLEQLEPGLR